MAASTIAAPGTEYGPCLPQRTRRRAVPGGAPVVLTCAHVDCAESRMLASSVCRLCSDTIGYDVRFYRDPETADKPRVGATSTVYAYDWVHAACLERAADVGGR